MTQVRIRVVQVFDNAFGPLEAFFAERASTVKRHNGGQIFQFHTFVRAQLKNYIKKKKITL